MPKVKKAYIAKAKVKRVQKIIEEHGDIFQVETEVKGTYLLIADDGWRGWISLKEAQIVDL